MAQKTERKQTTKETLIDDLKLLVSQVEKTAKKKLAESKKIKDLYKSIIREKMPPEWVKENKSRKKIRHKRIERDKIEYAQIDDARTYADIVEKALGRASEVKSLLKTKSYTIHDIHSEIVRLTLCKFFLGNITAISSYKDGNITRKINGKDSRLTTSDEDTELRKAFIESNLSQRAFAKSYIARCKNNPKYKNRKIPSERVIRDRLKGLKSKK